MNPSTLYSIGWISAQTDPHRLTLSDILDPILDFLLHTPIEELAQFILYIGIGLFFLYLGVWILYGFFYAIGLVLGLVLEFILFILDSRAFKETVGRMRYKAGRAYRHFLSWSHGSPG